MQPTTSSNLSTSTDSPAASSYSRYIISALLILVGAGSIVLFLVNIVRDAGIQFALTWVPSDEFPDAPSPILAFLEQFGIIVPLLVAYLGVFFATTGTRLLNGNIKSAQWAKTIFFWLAIGLFSYVLLNTYNLFSPLADEETTLTTTDIFVGWVLPIIGIVITGAIWFWMDRNMATHFIGEDLLLDREARLAWNLLIPTLTIFVLVSARPLEQTFIRSLTDKRFASSDVPQFVGLQNYQNLLSFRLDTVTCRIDDDTNACSVRDNGQLRWQSIDRELLQEGYRTVWNIRLSQQSSLAISAYDEDFFGSIWTTLVFAVTSVSLELLIGLFMALVVNSKFIGRGMMRAVMLIPWAIPTVISARLWELMLKDTSAGIVNKVLMDFNVIDAPQAWLSDPNLQLPTAIIVDVWKTAPFMALLLLAGLQTISKDLYEAAAVDGASPLRRFFAITLPLLRPAIAIALVFRTLDALRVFDLFNVLFGRQQLSMATYNFETLVGNQLDGYASAVSVIIFFFISIFAIIYVRMLNVETGNE